MQWVVNAYLLALAAFFALGGRLADLIGNRRIMVVGTLVFVISSVLCGCVPEGDVAQTWLIIFRATQGLGAALMFPAALAVVVNVFPVEKRGRALALFFGLSGALTAVGPLLGGWLTGWTWRAIFWVNVPVAVIALVLTFMAHVPNVRRPEKLDVRGAALVAVGMGLSVLGLQQAQAWGWSSVLTWVCILGGLAVLAVFVRYEMTVAQPLIRMQVFRDKAFTVDNLVLFFAMLAFVPLFFFASVYAQVSLSASPNQAALYLLYFFVGFAITSQWGGRILDKRGARPALKIGTALGAVGFALWAGKLTDLSMHNQWPYVALAGAGIGFLLAPASTDAVNRAIGASYGEVTGITQTVRNFAASVGLAVFGTMLTHATTNRVTDTLESRGLSQDESRDTARSVAEAVAGNAAGLRPETGPRRHGCGKRWRHPNGLRPGQPVGLLRDGHRARDRVLVRGAPSRITRDVGFRHRRAVRRNQRCSVRSPVARNAAGTAGLQAGGPVTGLAHGTIGHPALGPSSRRVRNRYELQGEPAATTRSATGVVAAGSP